MQQGNEEAAAASVPAQPQVATRRNALVGAIALTGGWQLICPTPANAELTEIPIDSQCRECLGAGVISCTPPSCIMFKQMSPTLMKIVGPP